MAVGEIHYKDLNKYTQEMFGDEYFRGEEDVDERINNINTQEYYSENNNLNDDNIYDNNDTTDQAHRNRFALDRMEMEEMNAMVGDPDEHDMEEQDYGYMVADYD